NSERFWYFHGAFSLTKCLPCGYGVLRTREPTTEEMVSAFPQNKIVPEKADLAALGDLFPVPRCKGNIPLRLLQKCFLVGSGWSISSRHRQGFDIVRSAKRMPYQRRWP